ncbi:MAG TPA: malonate decarboxylase holo-[acyl-carrier-protein] synthase [Spirochaetota bacterium]|nr:malonate decarboxylase holo-[acyl-carrier-protein] synthase [Spirochaetota bacterium]HPJ34228.1 malonate decarboxylase holo-[acyl-carrier-protein] synthase [Spirochaetota bacterium]
MNFMRHHLVEITASGRERLFEELLPQQVDSSCDDEFRKLILEGYNGVFVPGIVRRYEDWMPEGTFPVGFASLNRIGGRRLRIPAFIYEAEVKAVYTPYDNAGKTFELRNNCLQILKEVLSSGGSMGLITGVWGSAGLEIHTGLPFTDDSSDLDILLKPAPFEALEEFFIKMKNLGKRLNVRIDGEVDLPDIGGVKLAELFMKTATLLCKNINGVSLIERSVVMKSLTSG